jgi:hypothetical protein
MTLVNSLKASTPDRPVYHTHWLNPATIQERVSRAKLHGRYIKSLNLKVSRVLSAELSGNNGAPQHQWRVVTSIRDPVARNFSAFFLFIDRFVHDFHDRYRRGDIDAKAVFRVFLQSYPHRIPLEWFDHEIKSVFGVDVYQYDFDRDRGFGVVRGNNVDLLIIKVELLKQCYAEAFSEFFGKGKYRLVEAHVTEIDSKAAVYRELLKEPLLPRLYLDKMYESRFVRHFYRPHEIEGFKGRWAAVTQ